MPSLRQLIPPVLIISLSSSFHLPHPRRVPPPTLLRKTTSTATPPAEASAKQQLVEDLSDLTKESFFCLRCPTPKPSNTCIVECKRHDEKPLGYGFVPDSELDSSTRRAFVFTNAPVVSPGGPVVPPLQVHVREIPFSYGKLGGSIWYAAVALSQYVTSNPDLVCRKRVLELGAGVGLPGITAGRLGADSVTLTEFGYEGDLEGYLVEKKGEKRLVPSALLSNLRYNVELNGCERVCDVQHLDWYDYMPGGTKVGSEDEGYDVVLGADLVNWEDDVGPLIETLKHYLLGGAVGIVALSYENRKAVPTFLERVKKEFKTVEMDRLNLVHFDEHPMLLFRLTM